MNHHEPMLEEELERIERLGAGATGGPWDAFVEGRDFWGGGSIVRTAGEDLEMLGATAMDFDFIASARQDIPRLLEEVRAVRAELSVHRPEGRIARNPYEPLTEEELRRIGRLSALATGGPWQALVEGRDSWRGPSMVRTAGGNLDIAGATAADLDFIASARQDVPRLLEEVRALRAELFAHRPDLEEVANAYQPMTEVELLRIERLCAGAQKGSWEVRREGRDPWEDSVTVTTACSDLGIAGATAADLEFIASARQDVPRLLEEVRALRAELDRLRSANGSV
jgi:hypothetical protein